MSPEEHFRRLQDGDVWSSASPQTARAVEARGRSTARRDRGPVWVTAVVGASLVVASLAAVQYAAPRAQGGGAGGRAVSVATASPAEPATPTPSPSDSRSAEPTDPLVRASEFRLDDPADMARGARILACFKDHGVKIVDLEPSSTDPGVENIAYGGPKNDQESIAKGLQYQDECFAHGGPVG